MLIIFNRIHTTVMSNPKDTARPVTERIVQIVEEETGYDWHLHKNDPDKIVMNSEIYQFRLVWIDDRWRFEIDDHTYNGENPRWALGNISTVDDVYNSLPEFIPVEIRK